MAEETMFNGKEKIELEGAIAIANESQISVMFTEPKSGEGGKITINMQAYDNSARKWVVDKAVYAEAEQAVRETFGLDIAELLSNPTSIMGKTFEAYFDGERGSLRPIRKFTRFSQIKTVDANVIKKMEMPVESLPISEFEGRRFNFGFTADVKGEMKNFKVSQFIIESDDDEVEDRYIGVKYETKDIVQLREQLDADDDQALTPETAEKVREVYDSMTKRARAAKVNEFKEVLGIDVDEMIENDETITFTQLEVRKIPGSDNAFIVAHVDIPTE